MKNLRLKSARAAKDLSQEALAREVGVSRQTINAIEKGDYNPTIRLCTPSAGSSARPLTSSSGKKRTNNRKKTKSPAGQQENRDEKLENHPPKAALRTVRLLRPALRRRHVRRGLRLRGRREIRGPSLSRLLLHLPPLAEEPEADAGRKRRRKISVAKTPSVCYNQDRILRNRSANGRSF